MESVDGNRAYIRRSRKLGSVVTFDVETVDVVQSGRSNELGASLGHVMAYDDDLDVNITSNPAAAPFHDLVGYLNAVAIPAHPSRSSYVHPYDRPDNGVVERRVHC